MEYIETDYVLAHKWQGDTRKTPGKYGWTTYRMEKTSAGWLGSDNRNWISNDEGVHPFGTDYQPTPFKTRAELIDTIDSMIADRLASKMEK